MYVNTYLYTNSSTLNAVQKETGIIVKAVSKRESLNSLLPPYFILPILTILKVRSLGFH